MNRFLVNETDPTVAKANHDIPRLAVEPGASAPSQVGSAVRIEGEIYGQQDLLVDGEVNGSMVLPDHTLTIGPNANVKANIRAQNVVLIGSVEGNIEATKRIELRGCCSLLGDIRSPRIMVENGAYIKGTIEVMRQAPALHLAQPTDLNALTTGVSSFGKVIDSVEVV